MPSVRATPRMLPGFFAHATPPNDLQEVMTEKLMYAMRTRDDPLTG